MTNINNRTVKDKSDVIDTDHAHKSMVLKKLTAQVPWQDLRGLSRVQIAYNLVLPYPFLFLSWWFASQSWYLVACMTTYLFFAAAFRQAHDGYHHSLGVSKGMTKGILLLLSALLMTSLHSIRATHMAHHRDPLGDSDIEGSLAKGTWLQALLAGVSYRVRIYQQGLQLSNTSNRRLAWVEFVVIAIIALITLLLVAGFSTDYAMLTQIAAYHVATMILVNASVGIIAVWGVHHDCDEEIVARTERNRVVNMLTFNLLYHAEHHLFSAVPSNHLPELARRLDKAAPQLTRQRVVPTSHDISQFKYKFMNKLTTLYYRLIKQDNNECPLRRHLG
jgi:fatty acid desaturase